MKKLFSKNMLFALLLGITTMSVQVFAISNVHFQIRTESQGGDYIGQGQVWDFSSENNSKIVVRNASQNSVSFQVENFNISNMSFEFSAEDGKKLSDKGLFFPAKRNAFRGSYNGISISGDGRGCNEILGGFYVHEYSAVNGVLQKAAIDFVQSCDNSTGKLYGSLRYNSSVPNYCVNGDCSRVERLLNGDASVNNTNSTSIRTLPRRTLVRRTLPRRIPRKNFSRPQERPVEYERKVVTRVNFSDIDPNSLEGKAAIYLAEKNIIGGRPDGSFDGEAGVNRAELAKFLLLAKGVNVEDDLKNNDRFPDVLEGEWYVKYVIKAADLGIINGYDDGYFEPARTVNTAEFLKMFTKTFNLPEIPNTYKDVPGDAWYDKFAGIAQKYDLFPDRDKDYLEPSRELTRNEVAVAIYRYLNFSRKSEFETNTAGATRRLSRRSLLNRNISDFSKKYEGEYFEFSYPSDWEFNQINNSFIMLKTKENKNDALDASVFLVKRAELPNEDKNMTLEQLKKKEQDILKLVLQDSKVIKLDKIVVSGMPAYEMVVKGMKNDAKFEIYAFFTVKDGIVYEGTMTILDNSDKGAAIDVYNKILSSLKIFTEKRDMSGITKKIDTKNFYLEIPGDWSYVDLIDTILLDPYPEDGASLATMTIMGSEMTEENKRKDPQVIINDIRSAQELLDDRVVISEREVEIDGVNYSEDIFTYKNGSVSMKQYVLVGVDNGFVKIVLFKDRADKFDVIFPKVKKILNTLKFKD